MKDIFISGMTVGLSYLGGSSVILLAEATNVDTGILSLVGNGVTIVVLAWYVVYDVRIRTPAMLAAFALEQNQSREVFAKDTTESRQLYSDIIDGMRGAFAVEQGAVRQAFAIEQAALRAAFAAEQSSLRSSYEKQLSELRVMLFENVGAMRTAVHDVRNTAQTLMNKQSLKEKGLNGE